MSPQDNITQWLDDLDKAEDAKLKDQADRIMAYLLGVKAKLLRHRHTWAYEINQIDRMFGYVQRHKYLPDSYLSMLRLWSMREAAKR